MNGAIENLSKLQIGISMGILSLLLALTQILLRRLVVGIDFAGGWINLPFQVLGSGYFWATGIGFSFSVALWLWILPKVKLAAVYPMISLSYVAMLFLAYFVDGEPISMYNIAGVAIICIGIIFLFLGR